MSDLIMDYRPSETLLGIWVTRPLYKERKLPQKVYGIRMTVDVKIGENVQCIGVVPISEASEGKYEFFDSRRKVLGLPDGLHNHTLVVVAPIWIGWTSNAGKSFMTDQGLIDRHKLTSVKRALELEGYPTKRTPEAHSG